MPCFLSLDQSTSATKALIFDAQGRVVARAAREHAQSYPRPGWVEQDAGEIWQNTLTVLGEALQADPRAAADLACLSLTNQRETVVVFEAGSGRPLHPALVWQCRRGVDLCEQHRQEGCENWIQEKTGLRLDAYFSASKLQHLLASRPDLLARLENGEALVGTMDTYLIYRLTDGQVFATDHTNASRTLLYDIHRLDWDEELCRLWQVPRQALAEARDCTASFGETRLGGLLDRPLPICGVMGDSHASLFAHRCFAPGAAKVTFGTGSSILMNIGETARTSRHGVVTTLAWVHQGRPVYAYEGIIICSAATLSWLKSQLGLLHSFEETETLAAELEDSDGVYLVPAFSGLGLPYWAPQARAAITGLSGHSDRRHVVRAALESIAYQLKDALEAMRSDADLPLSCLHGDGGPTRNRFLMQFTADISGIDLRAADMPYCSALGATLAGMLATGHCRHLADLAALPRDETRYHPQMEPDRAAALLAGWQKAVRSVLGP